MGKPRVTISIVIKPGTNLDTILASICSHATSGDFTKKGSPRVYLPHSRNPVLVYSAKAAAIHSRQPYGSPGKAALISKSIALQARITYPATIASMV